ncbi:Thymidylate synthase [Caenispirillum salinarum AK4]|uniref:Thymidylate synthase n=1 Tax=Caenispirillum salinarum AK4 TaxID=1238182 RepID=K9HGG2_9PROT|nr:thymidylate synthase [Caenispirillum salinarum]EKV27706.1 Thymidylate synthase [Caenispirillum salinarum AK4]
MDNVHDRTYLRLLREVLERGQRRENRTGIATYSLFGAQMRFDLTQAFPLLTSKRVFWRGVAHELLWFLKGDTNIGYLLENGVHIWDEWADEKGGLGPVYGAQWRAWPARDGGTIDQIAEAVRLLREDPASRRIIVSAWNPADLPDMALAPCHAFFQFNSREGADGRRLLDCQLYQRSCDMFLGVPFNIASYALLTHMMAAVTDHEPGDFVWTGGDVHLYENHMEQARQQLGREGDLPPSPRLRIVRDGIASIDDFTFEDFELVDYAPLPAIKAPVAV